ncbi:MAG: GIY-YIG nuclease family protein [Patescibacteria group bacterium]
MHYVYILKSLTDQGWYIGYSEDVHQRFKDHNAGQNVSTKPRRPLVLIYYEAYLNKLDALGREKFLKSGSGRRFLEKQMRHYLETP